MQGIETVIGELGLSESAVEQLKTIFEAAVTEKFTVMSAEFKLAEETAMAAKQEALATQFAEEYEAKGKELVEQYKTKVSDMEVQADAYLKESVKEWIAENKVELTNSIKMQRMETFVEGMKNLLESVNIDVPESEYSMIEQKDAEIAQMAESLSVVTARLKTVTDEVESGKREMSFKNITEGLSDLEVEKLKTLTGDINSLPSAEYSAKLETIKEAFIGNKKSPETKPEETIVPVTESTPAKKNRNSLDESVQSILNK